jgi:predicted adenylyl cyclase CyaB
MRETFIIVNFACADASMPCSGHLPMKNLEAKFRINDLAQAQSRAAALGYTHRAILNQRDTFFQVANGKFKLREENGTAALIYYNRDESRPLMLSNYEIVPVADSAQMLRILGGALGLIAIVEKERTLMISGNVRFHLDHVTSLGNFGEIEAVIPERSDPEQSRAAVDELLAALEISRADLIDVSYFELLARGKSD